MDGGGDTLEAKISTLGENCEKFEEELSAKECDLTSSRVHDSVLEADCSCSSSNQSSTEGESDLIDFPSPGRDLDGSGDKDSGVDCSILNPESFTYPDKELMERVIKQVEFYFSDENLKKDNFLLKHVCRTKEGNVSLKLVSSFRKVKAIAKDWRVVAYSLRHSDKLVVNKEGTKIKRKDPLPDGCKPVKNAAANKVNKSVIAFNLPFDRPTMENVAELFARCGEVALIRILRPGTAIPPDIKKALGTSKHPEIGSSVCAVVEFESQTSAARAISEMDSKDSDWRALHVVPLMNPARNPNVKDTTTPKTQETDESKLKKKKGKKQDRIEQLRINESGDSTPGSPDGEWSSNQRSGGQIQTAITQPAERRLKSNSWGSKGKARGSPWVQRRIQAAKDNPQTVQNPPMTVTVVRQPRGPDGTRGFHPSYQMLRGFNPTPNIFT